MEMTDYIFTSESVSEGHPDKVADQISDAILDAILAQDPKARVACETMVTTGMVVIAGEITTSAIVDYPKVVRETIKEIGYNDSAMGFDWETCAVLISIDKQSPDISQGVTEGEGLYQGPGRRRPGADVRLCLQRDSGTHADVDHVCPQADPEAGRSAQERACLISSAPIPSPRFPSAM